MYDFTESINQFFQSLDMDSDNKEGHSYKSYIKGSIHDFLQKESKENAFDVYHNFFDSYRVNLQGKKNFIDLLDTLRAYEENASVLIDKQRDHYVHSVNVFLLGIQVYESNTAVRTAFQRYIEKNQYPLQFSTYMEEFFFRWGIAALFHDIGYPVEIMNNQLKKFTSLIVNGEQGEDAVPFIGYKNFKELTNIPLTITKKNEFFSGAEKEFDSNNALNLLSWSLSKTFRLPYYEVNTKLESFLETMQSRGFVDHGYYSAVIVLHWYGLLIEKSKLNADVLYRSILDSASAILLHNYYKNVLQKEYSSIKQLSIETQPHAYLLILCDELQEWNREVYGILDKQKVLASDSKIMVNNREISIHYITYEGTLAEDFAVRKQETFEKLLNIKEVFADSMKITCTTKTEQYITKLKKNDGKILPRPFLENVEAVAKQIHKEYNRVQLERHPAKSLEYPDWESLTDSLKYSNVRQARAYFDKLKKLGYLAVSDSTESREIKSLSKEQIEQLAIDEHESWCEERRMNGWTYGVEKDTEHKITPYLIPYDELSEEVKELDRDAVRNIIPLLNKIGLKIIQP